MVKVYYGDDAVGFAHRLLNAAEDKTSVVFSPDGFYEVPEDVADSAGVSYDVEPSESPSEAPLDDAEVEVEEESTEDAEESEDEDSESETINLRGKALNEALEAEGLPTDGKLAEKQARLAEALDKE